MSLATRVGDVVVELGFAARERVEACLLAADVGTEGGPLTLEALLAAGLIDNAQAVQVLHEHKRRLGHVTAVPFGQLARELDYVSDEALRAAVLRQSALRRAGPPPPLGEILRGMALLSEFQIARVLDKQQRRSSLQGTLPEGARLGAYTIERRLGAGGMGAVYLARRAGDERRYALKVILNPEVAGRELLTRFRREAEILKRLRHPHIVGVFEAAQDEGRDSIVMEYVAGRDLAGWLVDWRRAGADFPRLARMLAAAAEGLHHAHQQGVIHRNVKPANILVDQDEQPRVTDFGLAMDLASTATRITLSHLGGTYAYMAPEQALGKAVDRRADVYSLGAILYEGLTGRTPHEGDIASIIDAHQRGREAESPLRRDARVPRDLAWVAMHALDPAPARRYPTAGELAADLRRYDAGEPVAGRPTGRVVKLGRWVRRNGKALGWAAGAAVLALAAAGGIFWGTRVVDIARRRADLGEYLRSGQHPAAVGVARSFAAAYPGGALEAEARLREAEAHQGLGDLTARETALGEALFHDTRGSLGGEAWLGLADAWERLGRSTAALEAFRVVRGRYPAVARSSAALSLAVRLELANGRLAAARRALAEAAEAGAAAPDDAWRQALLERLLPVRRIELPEAIGGLRIADLDGDGRVEILGSAGPALRVWRLGPAGLADAGSWARPLERRGAASIEAWALRDADRDGRPDLALASAARPRTEAPLRGELGLRASAREAAQPPIGPAAGGPASGRPDRGTPSNEAARTVEFWCWTEGRLERAAVFDHWEYPAGRELRREELWGSLRGLGLGAVEAGARPGVLLGLFYGPGPQGRSGWPYSQSFFEEGGRWQSRVFAPELVTQGTSGIQALRVGDLDGQGLDEVVTGSAEYAAFDVRVYRLDERQRAFRLVSRLPLGRVHQLDLADVLGDERPEIIVPTERAFAPGVFGLQNPEGPPAGIYALRLDADELAECWHYLPDQGPGMGGGARARLWATGDVDGDGKADILGSVALGGTRRGGTAEAQRLAAGGAFVLAFPARAEVQPLRIDFEQQPEAAAIGDVDADGRAELVFLERSPSGRPVLRVCGWEAGPGEPDEDREPERAAEPLPGDPVAWDLATARDLARLGLEALADRVLRRAAAAMPAGDERARSTWESRVELATGLDRADPALQLHGETPLGDLRRALRAHALPRLAGQGRWDELADWLRRTAADAAPEEAEARARYAAAAEAHRTLGAAAAGAIEAFDAAWRVTQAGAVAFSHTQRRIRLRQICGPLASDEAATVLSRALVDAAQPFRIELGARAAQFDYGLGIQVQLEADGMSFACAIQSVPGSADADPRWRAQYALNQLGLGWSVHPLERTRGHPVGEDGAPRGEAALVGELAVARRDRFYDLAWEYQPAVPLVSLTVTDRESGTILGRQVITLTAPLRPGPATLVFRRDERCEARDYGHEFLLDVDRLAVSSSRPWPEDPAAAAALNLLAAGEPAAAARAARDERDRYTEALGAILAGEERQGLELLSRVFEEAGSGEARAGSGREPLFRRLIMDLKLLRVEEGPLRCVTAVLEARGRAFGLLFQQQPPDLAQAFRVLGEAIQDLGQLPPILQRHLGGVELLSWQAQLLMDQGQLEPAANLVRRALELSPADPGPCYQMARVLAGAGQLEAAWQMFEQALQRGFQDLHAASHDPHLRPLWAHPPFRQLMERVEHRH